MKFKNKVLAVAFAAATIGLAGCDNHKTPANQQAQQTTTVTQTAPAQQPVAAQPAGPHKDSPAEKQAKVDKLEGTDKARLKSMGYKVKAAIGMGTCNADGTDLSNSGWHGNSTSIQYSITLNDGENAKVCVEHHNFVPTVRNPVVLK